MSEYNTITIQEMKALIDNQNIHMTVVPNHAEPICVLFRIIEAQAEQITELRTDLERLAEMSGFGDCP